MHQADSMTQRKSLNVSTASKLRGLLDLSVSTDFLDIGVAAW